MKTKLLCCLTSLLLFTSAFNSTYSQAILQESFEGAFPPGGWTLVNAGSGNQWTQNTTATYAHQGTKSMMYGFSETAAANAWAFTPALSLNTNPVSVTFFVRARSTNYPEALRFTVGNSNTVASQTTVLLDSSNVTNTTFRRWTATFTPTTAGSYNFGFNCRSAVNEWNLYVDSVTISQQQVACSGNPTGGFSATSSGYICSPGNVTVSLTGATGGGGISYQFQSSPAGANNWSDVGTPGTATTYTASVSSSTDFRVRVTCSNSGASSFSTVSTTTLGSVPGNDSYCSPTALTLNGGFTCANTSCATSTGDPVFSASTPNNTVWYTFTPTVSASYAFRLKPPTGVTSGLIQAWTGLYTISGACPSPTFTEVPNSALSYDLLNNDSVTKVTPVLTAGTTYYIMIDGVSGSFGAFCIQIVTAPVAPACVTYVSPGNGSTGRPINDTLRWRSATGNAGITYDIYFASTTPPTLALPNYTDTSVLASGLAYNTTYYWYVVPKNGGSAATGCNASVQSFTTGAPPPPPANDECAGAINLNPYTGAITGTTESATQSRAAEVCAGATSSSAMDVWYKFTAVQNGAGTVSLTSPVPSIDAVIQIYSGTCGSLTKIGCADATLAGENETANVAGLVAGQTYFVRVYSYVSTGGTPAPGGTFSIAVSGTALPVTLTNLKGLREGLVNTLSWKTESETNNKGFEIERSANGTNFSSIGFIASKATTGNSNNTISYGFADVKPFAGNSYYRLKQVDIDGRTTLSNVVLIKGAPISNLQLVAVYPNPTKNSLNISVNAPKSDRVNLIVTDVAGKTVMQQSVQLMAGDNNVTLNVTKLSVGNYMIKAVCNIGCETAVSKFVKQ